MFFNVYVENTKTNKIYVIIVIEKVLNAEQLTKKTVAFSRIFDTHRLKIKTKHDTILVRDKQLRIKIFAQKDPSHNEQIKCSLFFLKTLSVKSKYIVTNTINSNIHENYLVTMVSKLIIV